MHARSLYVQHYRIGDDYGRAQPTPPSPSSEAREQLQRLVREIELLASSNLPPELFFREYLERVALALGADAAALWLLDGAQSIRLQQFVQRLPLGIFENPDTCGRYQEILSETLAKGEVRVYRLGDRACDALCEFFQAAVA